MFTKVIKFSKMNQWSQSDTLQREFILDTAMGSAQDLKPHLELLPNV